MKKLFALIIAAAMCIVLLTACATNNGGKKPEAVKGGEILQDTPSTPMKFSVADTTVSVGDIFSVFVNLDATGWTWDSFEFALKYDNTLVKINDTKPTELTQSMLNMSNLDYAEDMIKIAYASAEELEGGGDIVEIVCEALKEGSFTFEISELFASREVTYKATNEQYVAEIENIAVSNGTVTIEPLKEAQAEVHPVFTAASAEVNEGDTFKITINLSNVEQWDSFELLITYDNTMLKFNEMSPTELTANMLNMSKGHDEDGTLKLAFASAEEIFKTGDVVEIEFTALASGTSELKLSDQYLTVWDDAENNAVEITGVETVDGTITVR